MKRSLKYFIFCCIAGILIFNVFSIRLSTAKTESNLNSIKTAFAQSECPDDERNVPGECQKLCLDGTYADGDQVLCFSGCIDCTPKDCDAICGIHI